MADAGFNKDQADAINATVRDAHADTGHVTRVDLDAAVAALESRMAWRLAGAIVAQTLTLIGAMIAIVRMLG